MFPDCVYNQWSLVISCWSFGFLVSFFCALLVLVLISHLVKWPFDVWRFFFLLSTILCLQLLTAVLVAESVIFVEHGADTNWHTFFYI